MTDLAQRYGSPNRTGRIALLVAAALVAAAGLAWVVWAMAAHDNPAVRSQLTSWSPPQEHAVTGQVQVVRRDSSVVATCLLRASAEDHSIVGELDFTVGPGGPATATLTKTVRTERRATSLELLGCTAEGQPRPQ